MKHQPYADVPRCDVRVVMDEQGVHVLHCLVENEGKIVGQLPVSTARLKMPAGEITSMRLDVIGKWAKVDYVSDPVEP